MLLTETEQTEVIALDKSTKKTKVSKTKPKRIKVKLEDKLHTINGLKKVIEGRGKFKQVYHFVDGADKLAYKKYPAKKLSKELFNNGIKICINPDTKEFPAEASYLEGHWFQEAFEGNPFVGFKIKHKETSKVGQFPLSFGLIPAFSASIRWLEKQNKVK
jgi:hypothetical protein